MSKTWLIAGASNSISRALAQRLAAIEAQREIAFTADRDSHETALSERLAVPGS
jgi:hypothetical protein